MNKLKPHDGTDALKVIRNLLVIGIVLLLIAIFLPKTMMDLLIKKPLHS